ncbi:MAG: DNA double-strand break repair nuclease NurA [Clostridia bacterium]|nr:DNA double-strand break repair nuclease NurA [Clostridia bacterium]
MLEMNVKLKETMNKFNAVLNNKFAYHRVLPRKLLVNLIESKIDKIRHIGRFSPEEIKNLILENGIAGVDGSINTVGSSYPHYFSLMQALAMSTRKGSKDILEVSVHSPLLDDTIKNKQYESEREMTKGERDERIRTASLAKLELSVAVRAIKEMAPRVLLMDGALMRYKIYCGQKWDEFKKLALQKGVIVAGIIEEIKTNAVAKVLKDDLPEMLGDVYDREILFGVLEYGEMLMMKNWTEEKDLKKCFLRSSKDPHVIGMDMLCEQQDWMLDMGRLVMALTQENGRGIPLWLDIVDNQVKISDNMMKAIVETYIDAPIRNMLFLPKREQRTL